MTVVEYTTLVAHPSREAVARPIAEADGVDLLLTENCPPDGMFRVDEARVWNRDLRTGEEWTGLRRADRQAPSCEGA